MNIKNLLFIFCVFLNIGFALESIDVQDTPYKQASVLSFSIDLGSTQIDSLQLIHQLQENGDSEIFKNFSIEKSKLNLFQLSPGFHFFKLENILDDSDTLNFKVLVFSDANYELKFPSSGQVLNELPEIKWSGPDGVELWRWFISNHPFSFNQENLSYEGPVIREGWSSRPSIDLTSFSLESNGSLPFSPGNQYYYLIFPAYGTQEYLVDYNRALSNSFKYGEINNTQTEDFHWISPQDGESIEVNSDEIQFIKWSNIESSEYYFVRFLQSKQQGNIIFNQKVREFFTQDTFAAFNFNELPYTGKLILEVNSFSSEKQLAQDQIQIQISRPSATVSITPFEKLTEVEISSLDGRLPRHIILEDSTISLPLGRWKLNITPPQKTTQEFSIDLKSNQTLTLTSTQHLQEISGRILDGGGLALAGQYLEFVDLVSGTRIKTQTQSHGVFQQSLPIGQYELYIINAQGIRSLSTQFELLENDKKSLGDLVFQEKLFPWSATFINLQNQVVPSLLLSLENNSGETLLNSQTNSQGGAQFELSPGNYVLKVNHPGYENLSYTVQVPQEKTPLIQVKKTLYQISGKTFFQTWINQDSSQLEILSNISVFAFATGTQDTLWDKSNENGVFNFQIPNQSEWTIGAKYLDETLVYNDLNKDNPNKNIVFQSKASIRGKILNSNNFDFSVYAIQNGKYYSGTWEEKSNTIEYLFRNLPEAEYIIQIGNRWQQGQSATTTFVFKNQSLDKYFEFTGPDIDMKTSNVQSRFDVQYAGVTMEAGYIVVQAPRPATHLLTDTIKGPIGSYLVGVIPQLHNQIPLEHYEISRNLSVDTLIQINLELSHQSDSTLTILNPEVNSHFTLQLKHQKALDSAFLFYQYGDFEWTKASIKDLTSATSTFSVPSPKPGVHQLKYYFVAYDGSKIYSNRKIGQHYKTQVIASTSNWLISPNPNDTLRIPINTNYRLVWQLLNRQGVAQDLNKINSEKIFFTLPTSTWKASLDSSNLNLIIQAPNKPDTSSIQFTLLHNNDTLKWSSVLISADPLTSEIKMSVFPDKSLYLPGDTLQFNAWINDQRTQKTFYLNDELITPFGNHPTVIVPDHFIGSFDAQVNYKQLSQTISIEVIGNIPRNNNRKIFTRDSSFSLIYPAQSNTGLREIPVRLRSDLKDTLMWSQETSFLLQGPFAIHYPYGELPDSLPYVKFTKPDSIDNYHFTLFDDSSFQFVDYDTTAIQSVNLSQKALAKSKSLYESNLESVQWKFPYQWPYFFSALSDAETLSEPFLSITPNPFSPYVVASNDGNNQAGTRIDFLPSAPLGQNAIVHIDIYNMAGEVVRQLVRAKVFPQKPQSVYWDGLSDSGRLLRNGRYLVHFKSFGINNRHDETRILKSVVLFK